MLLPQRVELTGPEARQQLLAEAAVGGRQEDWTRTAEWTSSNPKIATVDAGGLVTAGRRRTGDDHGDAPTGMRPPQPCA